MRFGQHTRLKAAGSSSVQAVAGEPKQDKVVIEAW